MNVSHEEKVRLTNRCTDFDRVYQITRQISISISDTCVAWWFSVKNKLLLTIDQLADPPHGHDYGWDVYLVDFFCFTDCSEADQS